MKFSFRRVRAKGDEPTTDAPLIVTGVAHWASDEVTARDLRKAAYSFVSSGEYLKTDFFHDGKRTGSKVVGSCFVEKGEDFPPNSWVLSVAIHDPAIKELVLKGEINRLSFDQEGTCSIQFSRVEFLKSEIIDTEKGKKMSTAEEISQLAEVVKNLETLLNMVLTKLSDLQTALGVQPVEKGETGKRRPSNKLKSSGAIAGWH